MIEQLAVVALVAGTVSVVVVVGAVVAVGELVVRAFRLNI